jgi:hypothetical protein
MKIQGPILMNAQFSRSLTGREGAAPARYPAARLMRVPLNGVTPPAGRGRTRANRANTVIAGIDDRHNPRRRRIHSIPEQAY